MAKSKATRQNKKTMRRKTMHKKTVVNKQRGGFGQTSMQNFPGMEDKTLPFFDVTKDPNNANQLVGSRQDVMVGGESRKNRKHKRKMRGGLGFNDNPIMNRFSADLAVHGQLQ